MGKSKKKSDSKKETTALTPSALRRTRKATFMLNEKEEAAIDAYCKKNRIKNKSKFMREVLMRTVMDHFMEDYPTLFDKKDMDRIIV
ncbi:hypothetical protein [Saccharicrinis aurantiacus]|uniref:hypothetical protein n=1 Tax=Saccharicrinis aurantiacus TaxID=1849719 RepID=UPI0024929CEC|nr:hypothetical protein [Saccharicrinis aurantiacus]